MGHKLFMSEQIEHSDARLHSQKDTSQVKLSTPKFISQPWKERILRNQRKRLKALNKIKKPKLVDRRIKNVDAMTAKSALNELLKGLRRGLCSSIVPNLPTLEEWTELQELVRAVLVAAKMRYCSGVLKWEEVCAVDGRYKALNLRSFFSEVLRTLDVNPDPMLAALKSLGDPPAGSSKHALRRVLREALLRHVQYDELNLNEWILMNQLFGSGYTRRPLEVIEKFNLNKVSQIIVESFAGWMALRQLQLAKRKWSESSNFALALVNLASLGSQEISIRLRPHVYSDEDFCYSTPPDERLALAELESGEDTPTRSLNKSDFWVPPEISHDKTLLEKEMESNADQEARAKSARRVQKHRAKTSTGSASPKPTKQGSHGFGRGADVLNNLKVVCQWPEPPEMPPQAVGTYKRLKKSKKTLE